MKYRADDAERRRWQDPEAILAGIGLKAGLTLADIGCGGGFFALPAARIAGEGGKVYGVDVNGGAISELRQAARAEGLANLELTVGRAEDTVLCEGCADIVFFGMALHDFQEPARVLANARRMLKAGGRLVNLDWKKQPTPLGPPLAIRFSQAKAAGLIRAAGFGGLKVTDSGPHHYIITAKPA